MKNPPSNRAKFTINCVWLCIALLETPPCTTSIQWLWFCFINLQSFEIATLCTSQICILCITLRKITSCITYIKWRWLYIKLKINYLVTSFLYAMTTDYGHIDCVCGRAFLTLLSQRIGFKDNNQNAKISQNPWVHWF